MGITKVLVQVPALKATYSTGRVMALPANITVSVSYRCNSRCKTCNVWLLPNDDLTLDEWDRVFESLGNAPIGCITERLKDTIPFIDSKIVIRKQPDVACLAA